MAGAAHMGTMTTLRREAQDPATAPERLHELIHLAGNRGDHDSDSGWCREDVAANPNAAQDTLRELATDQNDTMARFNAARNPALDTDTLHEDIMEEIVGEIQDEFDEERPDVEKRDDSTYSINGMMLIEEVNSFFGLDISTDDYDTIGGWIYSQIENPPRKNQFVVSEEGFRFTIEETDYLRISRIAVTRADDATWEPQAETG